MYFSALSVYQETTKAHTFIENQYYLYKFLCKLQIKATAEVRVRGFHKFNPIFKLSTSLTEAHKNFKTFMLTGDTGIGKSLFIQSYVVIVLKLKPLIIYHYHTYDTLRNFNKEIHNRIVVD